MGAFVEGAALDWRDLEGRGSRGFSRSARGVSSEGEKGDTSRDSLLFLSRGNVSLLSNGSPLWIWLGDTFGEGSGDDNRD